MRITVNKEQTYQMDDDTFGVRVSPTSICNEALLDRLIRKTVAMLNRLDPGVSLNIVDKVRA